ncbi:MAG: hypothetical protein ACREAM_23635 [Blastocatellia bacterium]
MEIGDRFVVFIMENAAPTVFNSALALGLARFLKRDYRPGDFDTLSRLQPGHLAGEKPHFIQRPIQRRGALCVAAAQIAPHLVTLDRF